ncbi:MAG: hypothetical protein K1X56_04615 [Flavobacteriales bacterium]|nr:hypothetical protein [Flavobacteriales bacterium]
MQNEKSIDKILSLGERISAVDPSYWMEEKIIFKMKERPSDRKLFLTLAVGVLVLLLVNTYAIRKSATSISGTEAIENSFFGSTDLQF